MQVFNDTVFKLGYLVGQMQYPAHSLTLVVKGSFRLLPGRAAVPLEEQLELAGDDPVEDDAPSSLRYPLDLVHYKPRADLLLVGKCHPGPEPALHCRITFEVDGRAKSLAVFGDRHWTRDNLPSNPAAFSVMDLCYERSFGGKDFGYNPVGRGFEQEPFRGTAPLPNFEHAARLLRRRGEQQLPAGFGPLRRNWKPRADRLGTYDLNWKRTRWPWFPVDFDWGHMNTAPEDQQRAYLRGDERLRFEHLHPSATEFASALPGLRVRCFVRDEARELREVAMNLDTLWVDMETQTLVLLWRGVTPIASEDVEEALSEILVCEEPLSAPALALARYAQRLERLLAEEEPAPVPEPEPRPERPVDEEVERAAADAEQKARAAMLENGIDPDAVREPDPAAEAEKLAALGIVLQERPRALGWTRERVIAALAQKQSLAGAELARLNLSELDFNAADLSGADLREASLARAKLVRVKLDGALLLRARCDGADFSEASLGEADLSSASLVSVKLVRANLSGAVAERAVLRGADLSQARAKNLSAERADLGDARGFGAELDGANLTGATLARANFEGASLVAATLEAANAEAANFSKANLTQLLAAQRARFTGAKFAEARAERAVFETSDLSQADFTLAVLSRANFTRARLDAATFYGAQLKQAKFARASLKKAVLSRANLFEASFERADLSEADLSHASLYGAETWRAVLTSANLLGADVNRSKLAPEEEEP